MGKYYSINVKNNIKQFTKGLTRFQKRQVPFVAARTLTDVAFKVRFNAIDKSSNPLEYLVTHQRGGMKQAKSGNFIAVPSSKIQKKLGIRRNPQWRPTAVRNMKGVRVVKSGKYVRGKSEQAIMKGGERFYSLVRTVPIPKRLFFEENAERTVQKKIQYIWTTQLNRALQTSRYR